MVTDHEHVQMLFDRIYRIGTGRIGGRGQNVFIAANSDDIGRMATTRALGMKGVNGAALEGFDRVFHKAGFIQRVSVDHDLNIIGHPQPSDSYRLRRVSCPNPHAV